MMRGCSGHLPDRFKKVVWNADTGKTVLLLSNRSVTGIDNAGVEQSIDKAAVVHGTQ
jgi:hypothetical protein